MYKLTLCLKYLVNRGLAYFAMLGVAVCVFLMLVCVSVLTGFVDKIEVAAKGLFGDVVISSASLGGVGQYDELIRRIEKDVPAVEGASPFILTFGILRVPGTDFRRTVQVAGIRLPERATVSDFEKGLFVQAGLDQPTFDPCQPLVMQRLREDILRTDDILKAVNKAAPDGSLTPDQKGLVGRLRNALYYQDQAYIAFRDADATRKQFEDIEAKINAADEAGDDDKLQQLEAERAMVERDLILPPDRRAILGLGIAGLSFRTPKGEVVRVIGPGQQIVLSLIPLGRNVSYTNIIPVTRSFTVIDDCSTDVASIDSEIIYVPLETLQQLNNMDAEVAADDPNLMVQPARCSQIHIKVKPELSRGLALKKVARQIDAVVTTFLTDHPNAARSSVDVETWRERQGRLVNAIEAQRTLMILILGIISAVAVVLIFVILYVVVVQKTRDIGVLKAVGASNLGVAGIFLAYGGAIGMIGSIVGAVGGCFFVWNINPIHDWMARNFSFEVWNRETFMFEKIPNAVEADTVVWIVALAIIAGIFGSLLPGILAARRQPVEALRYE